jgi:hypothetical protein
VALLRHHKFLSKGAAKLGWQKNQDENLRKMLLSQDVRRSDVPAGIR